MRLAITLNQDELAALPIALVMESWHRFVTKKAGGKQRRAYQEEFTSSERATLAQYHSMFYRWIMRDGFPNEHTFRNPTDIELIERAGNFFAVD